MAAAVDSFIFIWKRIIPPLRQLEQVLALFGLAFVGKVAIQSSASALRGFWHHCAPKLSRSIFYNYRGKWAVAVQCIDDLGKRYILELAKRGFNIAFICSEKEKITGYVNTIGHSFGIETEILQINFNNERQLCAKLIAHLQQKDISLLINNIATLKIEEKDGIKYKDYYKKNLTVLSLPHVTESVLPLMLNVHHGAVLFILDSLCFHQSLGPHIDCCTKAFVSSYMNSLNRRSICRNSSFQILNLSYINTHRYFFSSIIGLRSILAPSYKTVVSNSLDTIGYNAYTHGYWLYDFQAWLIDNFLPQGLCLLLLRNVVAFIKKKQHQRNE